MSLMRKILIFWRWNLYLNWRSCEKSTKEFRKLVQELEKEVKAKTGRSIWKK